MNLFSPNAGLVNRFARDVLGMNALTFNVTTPPDAIVAAVVATVSHRTE